MIIIKIKFKKIFYRIKDKPIYLQKQKTINKKHLQGIDHTVLKIKKMK